MSTDMSVIPRTSDNRAHAPTDGTGSSPVSPWMAMAMGQQGNMYDTMKPGAERQKQLMRLTIASVSLVLVGVQQWVALNLTEEQNDSMRHLVMDVLSASTDSNSLRFSDQSNLPPALTGFSDEQSSQNFTAIREIGCCYPKDRKQNQQTCYTQRACTDPNYPFTSKEELEWFRPEPSRDRKSWRAWLEQCNQFLKQQPPSFAHSNEEQRWCGGPLTRKSYTERIPLDCRYNSFGFYVFPQAKLAVCLIPKVGLTEWLKFLRFTIGAADYQSSPYDKLDAKSMRLYQLPVEKQLEILEDNSWTKAVFLRDPAERLLSAFLDKIQDKYSKIEAYQNVSKSFDDFVNALDTQILNPKPELCGGYIGPSFCWDPHWRPQALHCGIHEHLPNFDFVGRLDQAANHTKALLQKVGLWETHGKLYTTNKTKPLNPYSVLPPNLTDPNKIYLGGFQQDLSSKEDYHTRGASSKIRKYLDGDGNQQTLKTVRKLYQHDFELWNALVDHPDNGWMTGKQLSEKANPSCSRIA